MKKENHSLFIYYFIFFDNYHRPVAIFYNNASKLYNGMHVEFSCLKISRTSCQLLTFLSLKGKSLIHLQVERFFFLVEWFIDYIKVKNIRIFKNSESYLLFTG